MIIKNGYTKSIPTPNTSNPNPDVSSQISSLKNQTIIARVKDIVLDENHPKFQEVGEWNGLGTIYYEMNNSIGSNTGIFTAKPVNPQSKTYPLINELVILFSLPDQNIGRNTDSTSYYYLNPISIWNHPHHDAYPNLLTSTTLPLSQQQDYQQTTGGNVRRVTDNSTEIQLNSPLNPSQNTFVEKTNIHPILPFMGDVIFEGRHGQSLRLGSTAKSNSTLTNNWSDAGQNGDPIMILRNGQSPRASSEGWIPITENIRNDLSSIYLTSFQRLKDFKVASELYTSYTIPPIAPSLFTQPQIAISSNRIVINAKTDSILLSAQKSVGISTLGSANIDSNSFYVSSNDIKLGSKNATEPVLKGDTTIELLKQLAKVVKDLATILEVDKNWPGGNLQTGYNAVAGNALIVLNDITSQLNDNSLKSLTTKVQ